MFTDTQERWIEMHRSLRHGECLARLERFEGGLGHAEQFFVDNIWLPAFGQFDHLHPEYEVKDFNDKNRYIDFAYVRPHFRIAIEIDGYSTHALGNISRRDFANDCHRQNHLIMDGWYVIRFAYDDLKERPRICQGTVIQMIGKWLATSQSMETTTVLEREIIRLVVRSRTSVTPGEVRDKIQIGADLARKLLHSLVGKRWLVPTSGNLRIRSYQLHPSRNGVKL